MNDFTSHTEKRNFEMLGEIPDISEMPFGGIDGYRHGLEISAGDKENLDFDEMMTRFIKTFNGAVKLVNGGDILFEVKE